MLRLPDPEELRTPLAEAPAPRLVGGNVASFVPRRPRNPLFQPMAEQDRGRGTGAISRGATAPVLGAPALVPPWDATEPLDAGMPGEAVGDSGAREQPGRRRRARRVGPAEDAPTAGRGATWRGATSAGGRTASSHVSGDCHGCPFALVYSVIGGAQPETVDHLLVATREIVAAARSFMEGVEVRLDRPLARRRPVQHFAVD